MQCTKDNVKAEGLNFWYTGDLTNNGPVVDIIAVQGLAADPYYTWVKKIEPVKPWLQRFSFPFPSLGDTAQTASNTAVEVMWLRDLLPNFVPNARIASYSYKSGWRKNIKTSLRECAEQFLNTLHQNRSSDEERQRPLIIIGHSLGGVVVKNALRIAVHGENFRDIRLATCGVIFLGTPHQGSSPATIGEWYARAAGNDVTLVNTLKKNSPILDELARDFESSYSEADIVCFYETKDGIGGIRIVDYISASLPSKRRIYLTTDHSGLNKFRSSEDENFLLVKAEICRMVKEAPKTVERQYRSYGPTVGNDFFRVAFDLKGIPEFGDFLGREEEIENIAKIMLPDSIEKMRKKICLLSGIGGVGKTQLAVEFARQNSEKFSAVFWIAGSTKVKLRLSIVSLAGRLPQHQLSERARSILKSDKEDFDAIVRDVLEWFKKPSNNQWLLIFDNVDREFSGDPEGFDIREYIPSADHGSILITSRLKDMQIARLKIVQLEPFDNQQGGLLLESIVGADLEGSSRLINLLQGLPLAINQAGRYIRDTGDVLGYIKLYENKWEELMEQQYEKPVTETGVGLMEQQDGNTVNEATDCCILTAWTLSFNILKDKSEDAAIFLLLWALLDNEDIWYELFTAALDHRITKHLPDWFRRCVDGKLQFDKRVRLLTRYAFVSTNLKSASFSMHAIVQRWCLHKLGRNIAMDWLAIVLTASAVPAETAIDNTKLKRRLLPHCNRTYRLLQQIPETIDDESSLAELRLEKLSLEELSLALNTACHVLAKVMIDLDKMAEAEAMYERALRGKEKFLGRDDRDTLVTVNNLGNVSLRQGNLQKAEEMYNRALKGKEKAYGPKDLSTMDTANNLGVLYQTQGQFSKALEMYQRALAGYEKALGPEHISTMDTLHNLGIVYTLIGEIRDAEAMYQRVFDVKEKSLGPEHTSTLDTVNDLGSVYRLQGKMTEAEGMYKRALVGQELALGPEHTSVFAIVNNLGILHADQGMMLEAEDMYMRAIDGYTKALGSENICTLEVVNNLANLYLKRNKLPEAEKRYVQVLDGYKKALGPEHPSTLNTVLCLGILYGQQERKMAEAEKYYRWALTGFEKNLGAEHNSTLATAGILGTTYSSQGKLPEAKASYLQALKGYENTLGREHISTIQIAKQLGILYNKQKDLPNAATMFKRALAGFEKALGPEDATTLDTVYHLGLVYYFQENFSAAEAMYERALAGYEKVSEAEAAPENNRQQQRLNIRLSLADLLEDWCKLENAKDQYRKVVQGYKELRRPADPVALKALDKIKSCEARIKDSGGNVPGDADGNGGNVSVDADGNGGNDGGGIGGCDVTGDVDRNNSGSGGGDGVSPVTISQAI